MPGKEHNLITEYAINLLGGWEHKILSSEIDNLINKYCKYPDTYFDVNGGGHEKALPYYFETDGIQFHYIPDTPIVDRYRYWKVGDGKLIPGDKSENLNWKHAKNGFTYYLSKAVKCLKENRVEDALSFTGCLLHMLQDACFALHSMEGPYGTDLFVLDRLFDHGDNIEMLPSNILVEVIPDESVSLPNYTPILLGTSVEESVFHLYNKYISTCLEARKLSFKIVQDKYEGKPSFDSYEKMFHNIVSLSADVINTICSIANGKFDNSEHLKNVFLSDFEPIDRPWGLPGPYRFTTMLKDKAIDNNGKIIPLKLIVDGKEKEFNKGMSFGSHSNFSFIYEIPKGVYKTFSSVIGLQLEFMEYGNIIIEFINDGKTVLKKKFDKSNPSCKITISDPGGEFEIKCSSPENGRMKTVVAMGNPQLIRL